MKRSNLRNVWSDHSIGYQTGQSPGLGGEVYVRLDSHLVWVGRCMSDWTVTWSGWRGVCQTGQSPGLGGEE